MPDDHDVVGRDPQIEQDLVGGERVVQRSRIGMLRGQSVVRQQHRQPAHRRESTGEYPGGFVVLEPRPCR